MTIPKPVIAVLLFAILCAAACKKNSHDTAPEDATLYIFNGGGNMPQELYPKLQITANASYVHSYNNSGQLTTKQLSDAIQDSLKPYLSSFPRAAVKADANVHTYSLRGAADDGFMAFIYIQKNPTDSTAIYLDATKEKPAYIQAFQQRINQTIINNKIFN
jgi:hypothetical protein